MVDDRVRVCFVIGVHLWFSSSLASAPFPNPDPASYLPLFKTLLAALFTIHKKHGGGLVGHKGNPSRAGAFLKDARRPTSPLCLFLFLMGIVVCTMVFMSLWSDFAGPSCRRALRHFFNVMPNPPLSSSPLPQHPLSKPPRFLGSALSYVHFAWLPVVQVT